LLPSWEFYIAVSPPLFDSCLRPCKQQVFSSHLTISGKPTTNKCYKVCIRNAINWKCILCQLGSTNACLYNLFSVGTSITLAQVGCLALAVHKTIILLLSNLISGVDATIRMANELKNIFWQPKFQLPEKCFKARDIICLTFITRPRYFYHNTINRKAVLRVSISCYLVIRLLGRDLRLEWPMNLQYFLITEISTSRKTLQRMGYYLHNFYKKA